MSDKSCMNVSLNIRPYSREILYKLSKIYEIIIFTASSKQYADKVISLLDPEEKIISHRFYREHCIKYQNFYVKDLRILENR